MRRIRKRRLKGREGVGGGGGGASKRMCHKRMSAYFQETKFGIINEGRQTKHAFVFSLVLKYNRLLIETVGP